MSKTWKNRERQVAAIFGSRRRPLSGGNSGTGGTDDIMHPRLYVECKHSQDARRWWSLFTDTEEKAKHAGKIPVVALTGAGRHGALLIIRSRDVLRIAREMLRASHGKQHPTQGNQGKNQ